MGYTISHYADFYDFKRVQLLGPINTDSGGEIVWRTVHEVLKRECPQWAGQIELHVSVEKARRAGLELSSPFSSLEPAATRACSFDDEMILDCPDLRIADDQHR